MYIKTYFFCKTYTHSFDNWAKTEKNKIKLFISFGNLKMKKKKVNQLKEKAKKQKKKNYSL